MNTSIYNISQSSTDLLKATFSFEPDYIKYLLGNIKENIFYFGLHPRQSLEMFYYYFVDMFAWFFFPACLGLILYLQKIYKWRKSLWVFFLSYAVVSSILVLYYGSWEFHDNPDVNSFTIGNSYTRYWLPIYLGALPLVSYFLIRFSYSLVPDEQEGIFKQEKKGFIARHFSRPRKKVMTLGLRSLILGVIFILSVNFVMLGSEEGLIYSAVKEKDSSYQLEKVLDITESNSTIITQYHDKLFFPERKVIVGGLTDNNMNEIYYRLVDYIPVYYYSFTFPQEDLDYLNDRKLKEFNLKIKEIKKITKDFTLYRLERDEVLEEKDKVGVSRWPENDLLRHISSKLVD